MHLRAKFHQNWSYGCGDTTFNVFQNGGHSPSWIFFKLIFFAFRVQIVNMHPCAKFRRSWCNRCSDIAVYPYFKMAAICHFEFVGQILGRPTTEFVGIYHCANSVGIALVVLIIQKFEYFVHLV